MKNQLLFIFILTLVTIYRGFSTHIVGGEFQLISLDNNNNYSVLLNVYFDDINGNTAALKSDNIITVAFYDKATNQLMNTIELNKISQNEFVSPQIPLCVENNGDFRTRIQRYAGSVRLDPTKYNKSSGYYLLWERCCRNNHIKNIVSPESTSSAFYLEFNTIDQNGTPLLNTTPKFNKPFGEVACVDRAFGFDFSATDSNSDSIRYELIDPKFGNLTNINCTNYDYYGNCIETNNVAIETWPSTYGNQIKTIDWVAGYSTDKQIIGSQNFTIDYKTGIISVTPSQVGFYVFAIIANEYKDGQLISRTQREYELMVIPKCPTSYAPKVAVQAPNSSIKLNSNDTVSISSKLNERCINVQISDSSDRVTLRLFPLNFHTDLLSTSTISGEVKGIDTLNFEFCWTACADSKNTPYQLAIIGEDETCPSPLRDTLMLFFNVENTNNNTQPTLSSSDNKTHYTIEMHDAIEIKFNGIDVDNDHLFLYAQGEGFTLDDKSMTFDNVNGVGTVNSTFEWASNCSVQTNTNYKVNFYLLDQRCPSQGIIDTMSKTFFINEEVVLNAGYVPINVFTPNNDGKNDVFEMKDLPTEVCGNEFEFIKIYNRWGDLVFESTIREFLWEGKNAVDGVYYYLINYEQRKYKGWIQVVR